MTYVVLVSLWVTFNIVTMHLPAERSNSSYDFLPQYTDENWKRMSLLRLLIQIFDQREFIDQ